MTAIPVRLQLSRRKGFNLQECSRSANGLGALKVDRTTRWGNGWKVGDNMLDRATNEFRRCATVGDCVLAYRQSVDWEPPTFEKPYRMCGGTREEPTVLEISGGYDDKIHVNARSIRRFLGGKNLSCWCDLCPTHKEKGKPLGVVCAECDPCHVDPLLEIANR